MAMAATLAAIITLAGSSWVSADNPAQSVSFTASGIKGSGGCNAYFGSYTQKKGSLKVENLASTRMGCAAEIMKREWVFLGLLEQAKAFEVNDGKLILKDAKGQEILALARKV